MDTEVSHTKMAIQIQQATKSAMSRSFGWQFEVDDLVVYVVIRHRRQAERNYLLKVSFDDFPRRAPSYLFMDFQSKQMTDAAWPPNVRHGAEPPGYLYAGNPGVSRTLAS